MIDTDNKDFSAINGKSNNRSVAEMSYPHPLANIIAFIAPMRECRKPIKIIKKRIGIIVSNDVPCFLRYIPVQVDYLLFGLRSNDDFICHADYFPDRIAARVNVMLNCWVVRMVNLTE